jgi:hypothetical protein
MTDLNEMAHALRALDPVKRRDPNEFVEKVVTYETNLTIRYRVNRKGVPNDEPPEVYDLEIVGVPDDKAKALLLDAIMADVTQDTWEQEANAAEANYWASHEGDDSAYDAWKEKQMLRAQDAYIEMAGDKE